jgi:clan AA aspartic protease (TIGR02281 family)
VPMLQCPSCASYNERDAAFCNQCGGALSGGGKSPSRRRPSLAGLLAVLVAALIALVLHLKRLPETPPPPAAGGAPVEVGALGAVAERKPEDSGRPEEEAGEAVPEVVELAAPDLARRIERALVTLELRNAEDRPMSDLRGVLVHPSGIVLSRFRPLLGAHHGQCRVAGVRELKLPILGVIAQDRGRDLALLKLGGDEQRLPALPLLEASPGEAFEPDDEIFLHNGQELREAVLQNLYHVGPDGTSGLLVAAPQAAGDSFLAADAYGYLVGLCRSADGDEGAPAPPAGARRVVIDPAFSLARSLLLPLATSLDQITFQLYRGTFDDLESRGGQAYRQRHWAEAIDLFAQALASAQREAVPAARLDDVSRRLRESYLQEVQRLATASRFLEAEAVAEAALGRYPQDGALWFELANARMALGMTTDAITAFVQLRALEPGNRADSLLESSYLRLGGEAIERNDARYAAGAFIEGLQLLPKSAPLHFELAKLYFRWELNDDAARLFQTARELSPALADQAQFYLDKIDDIAKRREAVVIPIPPGSSSIRANVVIDGRLEYAFIIDTGATYTAISERLARDLGYDPSQGETYQVTTAGGPLLVKSVQLKSLSLQGYSVRNLKALVLPDRVAPQVGLLGLNFLQFFKYGVDSRRQEFRLERP